MSVGPQVFRHVENPIAHSNNPTEQMLSLFYLHFRYFEVLFFPTVLSADWSFNCIPLLRNIDDPRNIQSFSAYLVAVVVVLAALWRPLPHAIRQLFYSHSSLDRSAAGVAHTEHHAAATGARLRFVVDSAAESSITSAHRRLVGGSSETLSGAAPLHAFAAAAKSRESPSGAQCAHNNSSLCSPWHCQLCSSGLLLFALAFLIIPMIPASNIFFWVGTLLAERLMYFPSIGACLIYSWLITKLWHRVAAPQTDGSKHSAHSALTARSYIFYAMLILAAVSFGVFWSKLTMERNLDWRSEGELFLAAHQVCPNSVKVPCSLLILFYSPLSHSCRSSFL
jgi:hypothetical protein